MDRNRKPILPTFTSAGDKRVDVADREDLRRIFAGASVEEQWKRFRSKHPRTTLVSFSAMGFSSDGQQGLVYVCFPGWYGGYYLMTREGGSWRIGEQFEVWIS